MHTEQSSIVSTRQLSLWRQRDFLLLWGGQSVSTIGSGISLVAFPFLVLALTSSPTQAGIVGAVRTVPYVILSLLAGAYVDRWNHKWTMIICDSGRALALGSIPIALAAGHLTLIHLYLVALVEGTLYVFFNIAATSAIPSIVPERQVADAFARNQLSEGMADICGPSCGSLLYSIGQALPFLIDALSYGVSVITLLSLRTPFRTQRQAEATTIWQEIRAGLFWVWQHRLIRTMAFLTAALNLVFSGSLLAVIVLALYRGATPALTGIILTIGSVGTLIGALITPWLQKRVHVGHLVIGATWLLGLCWLVQALVPQLYWLAVAGIVLLTGMSVYSIVLVSYLMQQVPGDLRGRVNSVFRLIAFGTRPLGMLVMGALLTQAGPIMTMLFAGGFICFLGVLIVGHRELRHA